VRGAGVDFVLRRQLRRGDRVFHHRLIGRRAHVVVLGDLNQELRFRLGGLKMRAVWHVGDEPAAVERRHRADAIGHSR
jgi:hypothetical protein